MVLYVDTEGTFRPERILEIATERRIDSQKVLKNMKHCEIYSIADLEFVIDSFSSPSIKNFKLIIVDSIIKNLRAEYQGMGRLPERQYMLHKLMSSLSNIARMHGIAVVVTNQIQSIPDPLTRNENNPTGGNVMAHSQPIE